MPSLRLIAFVLCCLGLAACAREAAAPAAGSSAAGAEAGAAATSAKSDAAATTADARSTPGSGFRIVSVLLGTTVDGDNVVIGDRSVFARKDRIHASVLSIGASQGLRLSARWLAPDGEAIAETAQSLVPTGAVVTTFTLSNARPWPPGDYRLELGIDGRREQTRTFKIR